MWNFPKSTRSRELASSGLVNLFCELGSALTTRNYFKELCQKDGYLSMLKFRSWQFKTVCLLVLGAVVTISALTLLGVHAQGIPVPGTQVAVQNTQVVGHNTQVTGHSTQVAGHTQTLTGQQTIATALVQGRFKEFIVPTANSGPGGIIKGPDGAFWFTEVNTNKIGRITTAGVFTEYTLLAPRSRPEG